LEATFSALADTAHQNYQLSRVPATFNFLKLDVPVVLCAAISWKLDQLVQASSGTDRIAPSTRPPKSSSTCFNLLAHILSTKRRKKIRLAV
jgi:hypothetical protein